MELLIFKLVTSFLTTIPFNLAGLLYGEQQLCIAILVTAIGSVTVKTNKTMLVN